MHGTKVSLWVTNVILAVLADVGYAPDSVRKSDIAARRDVPLGDKVRRSMQHPIRSLRRRW
jgi:hypothetical protein